MSPKFLSGGQYTGTDVPECAFWSREVTTDPTQDYARVVAGSSSGQCIANAYFARTEISCFNSGRCNGEGKCLPCTKYKYGGLQLGITHSPPLEILRQFDSGLSEAEVKSPNLARFPPEVITKVAQDQTPYHILIRNVQAKIAKCCHWSSGDGAPEEFFLAPIVDGPNTFTFTNLKGEQQTVRGIKITNSVFPDTNGSFFPVGTTVVAGFKSNPSFYIEPRTGLVREAEGVLFSTNQQSPILIRLKTVAANSSRAMIDTINATVSVCNSITIEFQRQTDFLNNAQNTLSADLIASSSATAADFQQRQDTACSAANESTTLGTQSNALIQSIIAASDTNAAEGLAKQLNTNLNKIADNAEKAAAVGLGDGAARLASNLAVILRKIALDVQQAGARSFSKCEFFFNENNVAKVWNDPDDGSLPCNGVRTECQFYTGKPWKFATDQKLEVGKKITGEMIQELRVRSDDWDRFSDPRSEFRKRFSTPFIWAFAGYVDTSSQPDLEDMLLYRPKVLFARDTNLAGFQTLELEKIEVSNFTDFAVSKSKSRIQPGSNTLDKNASPQYPTLISNIVIPSVNRLKITHPRKDAGPFIYRTWSADKNKISLFGTATPDKKLFFINETALKERGRYNSFLGTKNFVSGLPTSLPGSPTFTGISANQLIEIFNKLEDESRINDAASPLGYATANVDRTGYWQSTNSIDLVHNQINKIYVFLIINSVSFIFDAVEIDYRFLHSIPTQTSFTATDFSFQDFGGGSTITSNPGDTVEHAQIKAEVVQTIGAGNEAVSFAYGYYGARTRDRRLATGTLNADNDLQPDPAIADDAQLPASVTAPDQSLISSLGYSVVEYRKSNVEIEDWYVINDCGFIMAIIADKTANRVLPLPDQAGAQKPLQEILVNGGGKGSEIAQFALESASITTGNGEKKLVQIYRDPDGVGLPANYVILGPSSEVDQAFGRPDKNSDTIKITYRYLQGQSVNNKNEIDAPSNDDEVVEKNFYSASLKGPVNSVTFEDKTGRLTAGDAAQGGKVIRGDPQEYVWVFADTDGRPIGRKYSRLLVMYYGLAAINVEIYYAWRGTCTTYALMPDVFLTIGGGNGQVSIQPQGVTDPAKLLTGFRIANQIGSGKDCVQVPSCGDHEYLFFGGIRKEFEVTEKLSDGTLHAVHVSAGAKLKGELVSSFAPMTDYNLRRGPVWYPYILCDPPRYDLPNSIGPLNTQSSELINKQTGAAGFAIGANVLRNEDIKSASGTFNGLPRAYDEAYRGVDLVKGTVLDIHTTLRPCAESYTYGNTVLDGRISQFAGAARKRGAVDIDIYGEKEWSPPLFGNLGRGLLFLEVSDRRGDYLTDKNKPAFRWMPIFPDRETLGAGIDLFTENLEPQVYRMLQTSSPAGGINEVVNGDTPNRYSHKALVRNVTSGNLEYPFVGYYPQLLSDNLIGKEPQERANLNPTSDLSTMWAWREQEKPIGRGMSGNLLSGLKFRSPDYFLDNRGMEVRLRPDEGTYQITFISPAYDKNSGELLTNAKLRLGSGPEREIKVDFKNKVLAIASQDNTIYDTSLELGDGPLTCTDGVAPDNENFFGAKCTCQVDTTDETLDPSNFPSRFLHLDEAAPEGFFSLYQSTKIETPFAVNLPRSGQDQPCCQCVYYSRGIFASLDLEFLPTTNNINPAFDNRVNASYAWSRVPHGLPDGQGQDGSFRGQEALAENYLRFSNGQIFTSGVEDFITSLSFSDAAAVFPSSQFALDANANHTPISVSAVKPSELKPGAVPATGGVSRGEDETITLDVVFDTYVKINFVKIHFFAGRGWEVPKVTLLAIDPAARATGSQSPTLRVGRVVAESTSRAAGVNVDNPEFFDIQALQAGLPEKVGAKFTVDLIPSYSDQSFWNKFAMEFHLIFDRRNANNSMGIAGITLDTEALLPNSVIEETIDIKERKYYTSKGDPSGGNNPEANLNSADSATAYWRMTDQDARVGANKFRAYSWGAQIEDNQGFDKASDPQTLEKFQEQEYDTSRALFSSPYQFVFESFIPIDERQAIDFYGGVAPSWENTLSLTINPLPKVNRAGVAGQPLYGVIPVRQPWSAPGHAWSYSLEENYLVCCPECPHSMVVNYDFAHLHDNLDVVKTASFWEELPSGFSKLLRSTETLPDPFFGQGQPTPGEPAGTGQTALLDASAFKDIDPAVLDKAGFRKDPDTGNLLLIQGGE